MELRHLRYFVAVAEAGSLLKAAERLHIAQPAIGQQIAALEAEVGVALFARTSRGMVLTPPGKTFLAHVRVVLDDVERARSSVLGSTSSPHGEVALGLPTTVALAATVPIVQACRQRLPNVRLKVVEAYSGFLREWLATGRLDATILYGEAAEPALVKRPLLEEQLAFITLPAGGARRAPISLAEVAQQELVLPGREHGLRRTIEEACAPLGLVLTVVAEIDSLSSVKRAVECGVASTILTAASVADEVRAGKLEATTIEEATMRRRVVLATNVARPTTPALAAVMSLATDVIHASVTSGAWPARWIGAPA